MSTVRAVAGIMALSALGTGCGTMRSDPPPPAMPPAPSVVVRPPPVIVAPPPPAQVEPPPVVEKEKPAPIEPVADLEQALKYANFLRGLGAAELRRENDSARLAFLQAPSDLNRIRYALASAQPLSPMKDERRALELLEPFAKGGRPDYAPLRAFGQVLHAFVREQVRLGASAQAMKEKLDALMSLEKSLAERQRSGPRGGP